MSGPQPLPRLPPAHHPCRVDDSAICRRGPVKDGAQIEIAEACFPTGSEQDVGRLDLRPWQQTEAVRWSPRTQTAASLRPPERPAAAAQPPSQPNQPRPAQPSQTHVTVQDGRRGQMKVQQAACCPNNNVHPPLPRQLGRRGRRARALLQHIIKAASRAVLWARGREQGLHSMSLGLPCPALLPSGRGVAGACPFFASLPDQLAHLSGCSGAACRGPGTTLGGGAACDTSPPPPAARGGRQSHVQVERVGRAVLSNAAAVACHPLGCVQSAQDGIGIATATHNTP